MKENRFSCKCDITVFFRWPSLGSRILLRSSLFLWAAAVSQWRALSLTAVAATELVSSVVFLSWSTRTPQLVFRMEGEKTSQSPTASSVWSDTSLQSKVMEKKSGENISVVLQEPELWNKFHRLTNEMIVTKNGRRMFPVIKVAISGLDPSAFYSVHLEFRQIEHNRHKYINGEWMAGM